MKVHPAVSGAALHALSTSEAPSNSMVERWWRSLKHNWLFLNICGKVHLALSGALVQGLSMERSGIECA